MKNGAKSTEYLTGFINGFSERAPHVDNVMEIAASEIANGQKKGGTYSISKGLERLDSLIKQERQLANREPIIGSISTNIMPAGKIPATLKKWLATEPRQVEWPIVIEGHKITIRHQKGKLELYNSLFWTREEDKATGPITLAEEVCKLNDYFETGPDGVARPGQMPTAEELKAALLKSHLEFSGIPEERWEECRIGKEINKRLSDGSEIKLGKTLRKQWGKEEVQLLLRPGLNDCRVKNAKERIKKAKEIATRWKAKAEAYALAGYNAGQATAARQEYQNQETACWLKTATDTWAMGCKHLHQLAEKYAYKDTIPPLPWEAPPNNIRVKRSAGRGPQQRMWTGITNLKDSWADLEAARTRAGVRQPDKEDEKKANNPQKPNQLSLI